MPRSNTSRSPTRPPAPGAGPPADPRPLMPRSNPSRSRTRPPAPAPGPTADPSPLLEGRRRVVIEGVSPEIDGGRFPIKRVEGEAVIVEGDIFADGHDAVAALLLWRRADQSAWTETPMEPLGNDRWAGVFPVATPGRYLYSLEAWVDRFLTWRRDLAKRIEAGQDVAVALPIGAGLVAAAAARATGADRSRLDEWARVLNGPEPIAAPQGLALDQALLELVHRYPDRRLATRDPL